MLKSLYIHEEGYLLLDTLYYERAGFIIEKQLNMDFAIEREVDKYLYLEP